PGLEHDEQPEELRHVPRERPADVADREVDARLVARVVLAGAEHRGERHVVLRGERAPFERPLDPRLLAGAEDDAAARAHEARGAGAAPFSPGSSTARWGSSATSSGSFASSIAGIPATRAETGGSDAARPVATTVPASDATPLARRSARSGRTSTPSGISVTS